MKRWSDQGEAGERLDPLEAELAALLTLSRRDEVNPFVKRRVLVNVSRGSSRGRLPARRAAFAAVLLVAGSAGAAAVGRSDWGERLRASWFAEPPPAAAALTSGPLPDVNASSPVAKAAPPDAPDPKREEPRATVSSRAPTARGRPAVSDNPGPMLDAIQALRDEHNPVRAEALLKQYLRTHPQGALSEEALALSIEAVSGRNAPKAAGYAERYLERFPNGKYRGLALRALGRE